MKDNIRACSDFSDSSISEWYQQQSDNGYVPVFSQKWWLDLTSGKGNWDIIAARHSSGLVSSIAIARQKKLGLTILNQPPLTQFLGPVFHGKTAVTEKISAKQELLSHLSNQLPEFSLYRQNWHHEVVDWLGFYWNGFSQTTRYTYLIDTRHDLDTLWSRIHKKTRSELNKASRRSKLTAKQTDDAAGFVQKNLELLNSKGVKPRYTDSMLTRIISTAIERGQGTIVSAVDPDERVFSSVFLVWDRRYLYYLASAPDLEFRSSGASTMCVWESIRLAKEKGLTFDFEGSMERTIQRHFLSFGATQKPFFQVSKAHSELVRLQQYFKARH
ncbi:MAG: GNAT family N-acetyltransferase [Pseudomonadota bacterium]